MSLSESDLISFNSIRKFIFELNTLFGKKCKQIGIYNRLLSKTTLSHENVISRHIETFKNFCIVNNDEILNKDVNFKDHIIFYSENVHIDMKVVFELIKKESDKDDIMDVVWKYFLTISALVNPKSNAKNVLVEDTKSLKQVDKPFVVRDVDSNLEKEELFISDLIGKIEGKVKDKLENESIPEDPLSCVSDILSSGIINDVIGTLTNKNNNIDINKLTSAMVNVFNKQTGEDINNNPMLSNLLNNMNNMTNMNNSK